MKSSKGFTIIELIVVMAVFLFIIGAAIGIFLSIVQNQRRVLSEEQLINQISYVEEYMSKAMRMAKTAGTTPPDISCLSQEGYIYLLTHRVSQIYKGIKFINQSAGDTCQEFFLDYASPTDHRLVLWEIKGTGLQVALTSTDLQFDPLNPIRFAINGSDGSVEGSGCADNPDQCGASNSGDTQPRVTILLNIIIPGDKQNPNSKDFTRTIQTTVSRRNLNVQ